MLPPTTRGWLLALLLAAPAVAEDVPVGHRRELRGAWVASVANMNFPSRAGLSAEEQQQELRFLVDCLAEARFNAVFFHVRPEGDALYTSDLEPWSRFLTGQQGQPPGYDPLATLLELAHQRGIEVHAWLNPYRARGLPTTPALPVEPHLAALMPELVCSYGNFLWMDPSAPEVRERLVEVCADLACRYDLDGLHFDDYFYPYPEGSHDYPDQQRWQQYLDSGGSLSRADWRRQHVNLAIEQVSQRLRQEKPHLCFGVSPFGLPAPQRPEGIAGFDQFEKLYADTQLWMDRGWVDYLAPQLYWPTTRQPQAYEVLLRWWVEHAREGRGIVAGMNWSALGTKPEWTLDEYRLQLDLSRQHGSQGTLAWSVQPLLENRQNVRGWLRDYFGSVCLPPPLPRPGPEVDPPQLCWEGDRLQLDHSDRDSLKAFTLYRATRDGGWMLDQLLPPTTRTFDPPPGPFALAAVNRYGRESAGRRP